MGINLKNYSFRAPQPDYRAGDILRRVKQDQTQKDAAQVDGLVTRGWIEVQQGSGGYGWAVSAKIDFPFKYFGLPNFSYGVDGTYSGNVHDADGIPTEGVHSAGGGNDYGPNLPAALQALIDSDDTTTWQPALYIARVVHWELENSLFFKGCYILVEQVNSECTEVNKICRLHYRFEGFGTRR